ncbi:hypothetical protein C8Q79DRAFT_1014405 [Trametes meyenii]|nr:hypothetical protein C8Q79DRAFT_1014405 [Trametes meyenii]
MPARTTFPSAKAKPTRATLPTPAGSDEPFQRDYSGNPISDDDEDEEDKDDESAPSPPPKKAGKKKKPKALTTNKTPATEQPQDAPRAPHKKKGKQRPREDDPELSRSGDSPPLKRQRLAPHDPNIVHAYKALDAGAKHETRMSNNTQHMYEAVRLLPRVLSPYTDYNSLLTASIAMFDKMSVNDPEHDDPEWGPYWEVYEHFSALEERFPGLNEHLKYLRQHPSLVKKMATFMTTVAGKAHSDDVGRVKKDILKLAGLTNIPLLAQKMNHGFKHPATGRLLCPAIYVEEFDDDPGEFCRNMQDMSENRIRIFNPDEDIRAGFLQSKLVLDAYKLIFCGPSSVDDSGGKVKGKPAIAKVYKITQANFFSIVYVAVAVCFSLCALNEWDDNDSDWHGKKFAESVYNTALADSEWMCALKDWYMKHVFGQTLYASEGAPPERPTAYSVMKAQDAMRKQRQAAEKAAQAVQAHLKADKALRLAQAEAARRALDAEEACLLQVKKELREPSVPSAEVVAELDGGQLMARKGEVGEDEDEDEDGEGDED